MTVCSMPAYPSSYEYYARIEHYAICTVYSNSSLIRCIIVQVDWGDESPTRVSPWEASFYSRKFRTTHTATTLASRTTKYLLDVISEAKKTPKFELFVKPVCNTLFIATDVGHTKNCIHNIM